jgi:hypothetical protein
MIPIPDAQKIIAPDYIFQSGMIYRIIYRHFSVSDRLR